jgi:hypothetical protein
MKKILAVLITIGLCVGVANAQVSDLNVPGSLLVFPIIDNTGGKITYIDLVNRADIDVTVKGMIIAELNGTFHKKDFIIELTKKQPIFWDTAAGFNVGGLASGDYGDNFVQGFAGYKGFMFLWAVESDTNQIEIAHNDLKAEAIVANGTRAFKYNAIPHQALAVVGDYVLNLDGVEYTQASERLICEGLAGNAYGTGVTGELCVANLEINMITSEQPAFDINLGVWNTEERFFSRHVDFDQYNCYDLADLQLRRPEINSDKFQFATDTDDNALWAIFYQELGAMAWGGQCFMDPAYGQSVSIVLSDITQ